MIPLKKQLRKNSSFTYKQVLLEEDLKIRGVLKNKGVAASTLFPGDDVGKWQHSSFEVHNKDLTSIVSHDILIQSVDSERRN